MLFGQGGGVRHDARYRVLACMHLRSAFCLCFRGGGTAVYAAFRLLGIQRLEIWQLIRSRVIVLSIVFLPYSELSLNGH